MRALAQNPERIGIAPNCTALAGPSRTVSVAPGETSVVRFDLTCDES